jgi:homoserine dehydrogenase
VTKILSESEISIEAVIQKESEDESDNASIVILTDSVEEHVMQKAILTIGSLPEVSKGVVDIRLESMS